MDTDLFSKFRNHNCNYVVNISTWVSLRQFKLGKSKFEPVLPFCRTCSFPLSPCSSTFSSKPEPRTFPSTPLLNLINLKCWYFTQSSLSCHCQVFIITCLDCYSGLLTGLSPAVSAPSSPSSTPLPEWSFSNSKQIMSFLKILHGLSSACNPWCLRHFSSQSIYLFSLTSSFHSAFPLRFTLLQ